ncbi:MAG TPA: ATP-binding protein [Candidatus Hydrogenedentes bacterium]|jgi:SpoVK/Ycf46/Vps4 family AAA+-type ATPase|nr:ATP-binding protein [Candidatus Hydrogenedentota bacterium]
MASQTKCFPGGTKDNVSAGVSTGLTETSCIPAPFCSNDQILESILVVFRTREELRGKERLFHDDDSSKVKAISHAAHRLSLHFHGRLALTPRSVLLADTCKRLRLNRIETEILLALLLDPLGLCEHRISDVGDVLRVLALPASTSLSALRALSETGKLYKKDIIFYNEPDDDLRDRNVSIDPGIVQSVLQNKNTGSVLTDLNREDDLRDVLARLTRTMQKKSEELNDVMRGYCRQADFQKWSRKQDWLIRQLDDVLRLKPTWKLSRARTEIGIAKQDWTVLLALMGKALSHVKPDNELFTGAGLSRTICDKPEQFSSRLDRLMSSAPLLQNGYIQPCGGNGSLLSESAESIQETEYELTGKTLKLLGLEQSSRIAVKRDAALRMPRISLKDLALPQRTRESVHLALDQVRNSKKLMQTWGLRSAFPYGTGITMLFYGPPGTGKTATAEAIARELDKALLVADYSKIQNCFVGQTEKNIVSTFQKARQNDAVLFWDEADAMFFDRDAASRAWEVRDVNVLLQEIERFEGVCILATNRKTTLDKALERRIAAKVEFPRPDRELRKSIWQKLIPKQLPLAPDVDIARLSRTDLAGGEIKNVILNASRFACGRSSDAVVTAGDFERALAMETEERWTSHAAKRSIGFTME